MGYIFLKLKVVRDILAAIGLVFGLSFVSNAMVQTVPTFAEKKVTLVGPGAEVEKFMDEFFTDFASFSKHRRADSKGKAMIPLLRLTKSNYEMSNLASESVLGDPSLALIAKLWIHGPRSWEISDMNVVGDTAYARVAFQTVQSGRSDPIPFGLKFLKVGAKWKINGFVDLRSVSITGNDWYDLIVESHQYSPEAFFTAYMDKIATFYSPKKARRSIELAPQIEANLAPLWLQTPDASKSSSRAMMTFSQLQPRNWQFVSSDYVDENAELIIKASAGNPAMRRNLGMAAMMGNGLKFTMERVETDWLLKSYGRVRSK
jgi:hypothetical protein